MPAEDDVIAVVSIADAPVPPGHEDWQFVRFLRCDKLVDGLASTIGQATLRWDFGQCRRSDHLGEEAAMAYVAKLDLRKQYVLIEFTTLDDRDIAWIGYVRDDASVDIQQEEYAEGEFRVYGGVQTFVAYDLRYHLARAIVCGVSSRQADRNRRPVGYNCGAGIGRSIDQARRGNRSVNGVGSGNPEFPDNDVWEFDFSHEAEEWTAWDAANHLLAEHCPRNQADARSPVQYFVEGVAKPFTDWYKPTVEIEGRKVLELLSRIIDPRRGLTWHLTTKAFDDDANELIAVVKVSSIATAGGMALPDGTLPAAASITTIAEPNLLPLAEPYEVSVDGSRRWDRVRVRGARRTTTFSAVTAAAASAYSFPTAIHSRIVKGWSDDAATEYLFGIGFWSDENDAARNDRYRQADKFERVFRYFTVEIENNSGFEISPIVVQSTGSITGSVPMERLVQRLDTETPLKVGVDYTNALEPEEYEDPVDGEDFVRPFAIVYLPTAAAVTPVTRATGEGVEAVADGGWRWSDKLAPHKEIVYPTGGDPEETEEKKFKANYEFALLAGEPGFYMRPNGNGSMPHSLATAAQRSGMSPTQYHDGISWEALLITATVEWDAFCEAVWPEAPPTANPIEELLVQLDDERARYDWLVKGTVFDLDEHGKPKQVTTAGAIRDDRKLCETIAKLAWQWYGQVRSEATFNLRTISQPWALGTLLTTIGSGDAEQTVNAVVSQITFDFERGATLIRCNYPEVDFEALI